METIEIDVTLDCRGLSCPMPMLKVKKALSKMSSGQVLHMQGTDPGTKNDIEKGAKMQNSELLGVEEEDGYTSYYLKKL